MRLMVHHTTRRGAVVSTPVAPDRLEAEMRRHFRNREDTTARYAGRVVGEVFRRDGRWTWWCERDPRTT